MAIKTIFFLLTLCLPSSFLGNHGLIPLSEQEQTFLEHSVSKVIEVLPNQLGLQRIYGQSLTELPQETFSEFCTLNTSSKEALHFVAKEAPLPSSVDNSKLPCFPPIGDQGPLGSCVGWGSTYYQATHEIGLVRGWNNKDSFEHILSPKWTYNFTNRGNNEGSSPITAYQLLSIHGAPTILQFPYDQNYTAWDLNPDDWVSALFHRMAPWTLIPGLGGSEPQNLTAIKQALNNGHVLTVASFADSWVYTRIKPDPEVPHSPHVGDYAVYWMNGQKGGHFMTIVGYDDNVWIDINDNGIVDEGERGAFLIANSWGKEWGNRGFIWISYDAFLAQSRVEGGPSHQRVPAGECLNSCVIALSPKAPYYTPKLVAQFSLTQSIRNKIQIQAGVSDPAANTPAQSVDIPAFSGLGGALGFAGRAAPLSTPQAPTFTIDLSDFLSANNARYYLLLHDTFSGSPTTLYDFSLLDVEKHKRIESPLSFPQTYDNTKAILFVDY